MSDVPSQSLRHSGAIPVEPAPEEERLTDSYLWRRKASGPRLLRGGASRGLDRAPDFAPRGAARNGGSEDFTGGMTSPPWPNTRRRMAAASLLAILLATAAFFIWFY